MRIQTIHKMLGSVLLLFISIHLFNHISSLYGIEKHMQLMDSLRLIYRNIFVESLLLLAVVFQIYSGLKIVLIGRKFSQKFVTRLQVISGLYIAFFLIIHVSAVFFGRFVMQLDTNFYFAVAGIHVSPFQFFFIPYYFLAVVFLFTHIGCAIYWLFYEKFKKYASMSLCFSIVVGIILSLLIVLTMSGKMYPIDIPDEYKVLYQFFIK